MTPDQIAIAQLELSKLQTWITAIAIFLGPLAGVLFTLWFQSRKEVKDAKLQLFLTLMAERKTLPPSAQVTQALNKIDVVFADCKEVKALWHEYYAMLHQSPSEPRTHKWMELLTAMAKEMRYSHLSQLDLDKFYTPQGHVDDVAFQRNIAQQWARVLANTERFVVEPKENPEA
jgi:hypothetical protein